MLLSAHLISIEVEQGPGENDKKLRSPYLGTIPWDLPPPPLWGIYSPTSHFSISINSLRLYTFLVVHEFLPFRGTRTLVSNLLLYHEWMEALIKKLQNSPLCLSAFHHLRMQQRSNILEAKCLSRHQGLNLGVVASRTVKSILLFLINYPS
jgi:hypothetical protein